MNFKLARRLPLISTAATLLVFLLTSTAFAQSSVDTYGGGGGNTQAQIDSGGALPFTGFDLALAFGGGIVLLLAGAAMALMVSHRSAEQS